MRTDQERYFITNIIFPLKQIIELAGIKSIPTYNDDKYSVLKERIEFLCVKVLHIFEQPEFSQLHGITKRNHLNANDPSFHRILSYGIKAKHGSTTSRHYSNYDLQLPIGVYSYTNYLMYDFFYIPLLTDSNNNEFFLYDDIEKVIDTIIDLYGLRIEYFPSDIFDPKPRYKIVGDVIKINLEDICRCNELEMLGNIKLRHFEYSINDWIVTKLNFGFHVTLATPEE